MSRVWPELLPELAEHIASFLDTSDVACGLRLVNKAAAAQFRGPQHTTIRLSATLVAPHHMFVAKWAAPGAMRSFPLRRRRQLLCLTAASGSIPKVEWLEGQGCPRTADATKAAASRPHSDAADRLAWLLERGYPVNSEAYIEAAGKGNVAVLERLQAETVHFDDLIDGGEGDSAVVTMAQAAATRAARGGHLAFLQALHRVHRSLNAGEPAKAAAREGHLHVVAWLVEEAGEGDAGWNARQVLSSPRVLRAAAKSGSVELMALLVERGCDWDAGTFTAAAKSGCEEALEWLAERGCPMEDGGDPYLAACDNGDLATLRCLRRLGCPWGPAGRVLSRAVHVGWLPALRWLREEGCPAPADLLAALARGARARGQAEVADLLEGWQRMHESDTCG